MNLLVNRCHVFYVDSQMTGRQKTSEPHDIASWRIVVAGLVCYVGILILAVYNNRIFFGRDSVVSTPLYDSSAVMWEFIGTNSKAEVDTYVRKVPGGKLFAFKGAMVVDAHISDVLFTYGDTESTPAWVDLLQIMETFPIYGDLKSIDNDNDDATKQNEKSLFGGFLGQLKKLGRKAPKEGVYANNILLDNPFQSIISDYVYQYYSLPWPVAPRDFLFRRDLHFYPAERSVASHSLSTEHVRRPPVASINSTDALVINGRSISKSTIRAESPFTNWLFQDLGAYCDALHQTQRPSSTQNSAAKGRNLHRQSYIHSPKAHTIAVCDDVGAATGRRRTYVEIEALVDNKGSLPAWFVNYVQR